MPRRRQRPRRHRSPSAAVLAPFVAGFGLAALAAALALAVAWWLALLIVFVVLAAFVVTLVLVAAMPSRDGTPLRPEQAIEEARLTKRVLRARVETERRSEDELRREISSEREQLAEAFADLREGVDAKRRPAAIVGGALAAGAAVLAMRRIVRRLTGG